jgi:Flp pilus assembly protein TadG
MVSLSARQLARFRRDRRGNAGMIFGLASAPLIGPVGCGIDYGRQSLVHPRLDAAALGAIAKSFDAPFAQGMTMQGVSERSGKTASPRMLFQSIRRGVLRLLTQHSASAAVDFAMVVPAFLLLVVETMQIGVYFYTLASLDHATNAAARQIMTGAVYSAGLTAAQFRTQILCPLLPGSMSCSSIVTNIQNVPEAVSPAGFYTYVNASATAVITPAMNNNLTSFCPGISSSNLYVQVYYAMPVISPIWYAVASVNWNGNTVHFVSAAAAFKNEPFQSSSQPGC